MIIGKRLLAAGVVAALALSAAAGAAAPPQYFAVREAERIVFPSVAKPDHGEQHAEQHGEKLGDEQPIAESPPDATLPEVTETPSSPPSEA